MATEQTLRNLGWGKEEARRRAAIIDASHASAAGLAAGLAELDHVAVEYSSCGSHDRRPTEAVVVNGRLQVGGCIPSPGMVGARLTLPWRGVGGDWWTMREGDAVAVLANGVEVGLGPQTGGVYALLAAGAEYPSVLAAALALTPAR